MSLLLHSLGRFTTRLLDGDNDATGPDGASAFNVFKQRKFKLQPIQRICQRFPVVPQCERGMACNPGDKRECPTCKYNAGTALIDSTVVLLNGYDQYMCRIRLNGHSLKYP